MLENAQCRAESLSKTSVDDVCRRRTEKKEAAAAAAAAAAEEGSLFAPTQKASKSREKIRTKILRADGSGDRRGVGGVLIVLYVPDSPHLTAPETPENIVPGHLRHLKR